MQLTIEHLTPYLPYGLEIFDIGTNRIVSKLDIDNIGFVYRHFTSDSLIKPLLRPLSDLTKEIEVDGEKFVPISELAKIGTREDKCYVTNSNLGTCYVDAEYRKKGFFVYHPNGYFIWQVGKNAEEQTVYNQHDLFSNLFKWHFDINNLIDKGLAIDINTLPPSQ